MSDLGHSLDLPFEKGPGGQSMPLDEPMHLSGGVVALAVTVPIDAGVVKPGVMFRFATPTGSFYPPMLLVLDDDQAVKLPKLIREAIAAAVEAARTANRHADGGR